MQGFDAIQLTPCSTETYNPADLTANQNSLTHDYDTDKDYRDWFVPP
jgi:hypothetical protein